MRGLLVLGVVALVAAPAMADYYVAGDFNGWDPAGSLMTDLGGGIWQLDLSGVPGFHEFKVTVGDWSTAWPGSGNSWYYDDGPGNVTITWDTNLYADGWSADGVRIGLNTDPGTWTAVGDWQGWNNADSATAMVAQGGGIYKYQQNLSPGWHEYKAVMTGSWNAIGADNRSVNADTWWFEVTAENPTAVFWLDALNGAIKVDVVPEPASLLLLLAGLPLLRRRSA